MLDTSISVKTDRFDGPLSLLLLLIQKEEMNIRELDLTKITKQYLGYLGKMRDLNFDVAGEYLYLASTLLLLKSRNCISEEENHRLKDQLGGGDLHITSHAELIRRLEELQHFKAMGEKLWQLPKKGHEVFVKAKVNRKAIVNSILVPMELDKLTMAMMEFLFKDKRKYTAIKRDRLSIKEKLKFLTSYLKQGEKAEFYDVLGQDGDDSTENKVITFISLLELARLRKIGIFQNEEMGNIYIDVVKRLDNFDIEQADGFEEDTAELAEMEAQKDLRNKEAQESIEIKIDPVIAMEQQEPVSTTLQ